MTTDLDIAIDLLKRTQKLLELPGEQYTDGDILDLIIDLNIKDFLDRLNKNAL